MAFESVSYESMITTSDSPHSVCANSDSPGSAQQEQRGVGEHAAPDQPESIDSEADRRQLIDAVYRACYTY